LRARVSILLPAYCAQATLPAALRSIQRQTEPRWECVVVDDGSSDGTAGVARHFAQRDARFRVLRLPHGGLVRALNQGLEACSAPLVARMDADDLMHRERLALQAGALEGDPSLDAVGCHVRMFPRDGLAGGMRDYERWLCSIDSTERVRAEAFVECPVAHPTLLIRSRVLKQMRYRELGWPEDYDLILRLLAAGREVSVLPRRLLSWRDEPGRLSRSSPVYAIDRFTACKAAFLAEGPLAGSTEYVLWGYGATGKALRRALLEHGRHPSHIVELHPGRLGTRIHGAPVIAPELLETSRLRPIVVSVAGAGPRQEIREELARMGFREGRDFVCAA
jgi:cellulose synthase/poly-beta-1,6-N-acetylglucosamine synthase-like glycosyltransferase